MPEALRSLSWSQDLTLALGKVPGEYLWAIRLINKSKIDDNLLDVSTLASEIRDEMEIRTPPSERKDSVGRNSGGPTLDGQGPSADEPDVEKGGQRNNHPRSKRARADTTESCE